MDPKRRELTEGVRHYARAFADVERMGTDFLPVLPHQQRALKQAETALAGVSPQTVEDLHTALSRRRGLAGQIDQRGGLEAIGKALNNSRARKEPWQVGGTMTEEEPLDAAAEACEALRAKSHSCVQLWRPCRRRSG